MAGFVEKMVARIWNSIASRKTRRRTAHAVINLVFGFLIKDGEVTKHRWGLSQSKRAEHIAILGKTGTGKSSFIGHLAIQDIRNDLGFVNFDYHGDAKSFLLSALAAREQRDGVDLSDRIIVIDPSDPAYSVGLNVLEATDTRESFVQIAEFAQILKTRWHLDSFGARTEELLRNALYVLRDSEMTLLELSPLLTNAAFRQSCIQRVTNLKSSPTSPAVTTNQAKQCRR
jgi:DNA helicase HerA-like ATPase